MESEPPTEVESRVLGGSNGRWTRPVFLRSLLAFGEIRLAGNTEANERQDLLASTSKSAEAGYRSAVKTLERYRSGSDNCA